MSEFPQYFLTNKQQISSQPGILRSFSHRCSSSSGLPAKFIPDPHTAFISLEIICHKAFQS